MGSTSDGLDGAGTCSGSDVVANGRSWATISGPACGGKIAVWKLQHMHLLVAMLQAGISVDKTSLLAGTSIQLSSQAASKDGSYKVRGTLEQINANPVSKANLDTVLANLSSTATPALFTGYETRRCAGALQSVEGGGTAHLNLHWLSPYAAAPPSGANVTADTARAQKVISAFAAPGNDYIACQNVTVAGRSYFDPTTSPDGFASPASSGSCITYSTAAISTDPADARFASAGCNAETGQNCTPCNVALDSNSACSSRVVWRKVGSSSAWRCRAM